MAGGSQSDADVIVIGAGCAGLAAALDLTRAGLRVLVVEARNRIGGRVYTVHDPLCPVPIELGAEFIHGKPPETLGLVEEFGLATIDGAGELRCAEGGGAFGDCGRDESFGDIFEEVAKGGEPDRTFQELLDGSEASEAAKEWAASHVEGYNAADRQRISVQSLALQQKAEEAIGGDSSSRIVGGYDRLTHGMYARVGAGCFRLSAAARRVEWERGRVRVVLDGGELTAAQAVVTVPVGALAEVRFEPEPADALQAAGQIAMGHAARVVFRFRERFWEAWEELADLGFLLSQEAVFPTWWTQVPVRAPVLTAWAGGPKAEKIAGCEEGEAVELALGTLGSLLGLEQAAAAARWWRRATSTTGRAIGMRAGLTTTFQRARWLRRGDWLSRWRIRCSLPGMRRNRRAITARCMGRLRAGSAWRGNVMAARKR